MKKILIIILVLSMLISSVVSFTSCDTTYYPSDYDNGSGSVDGGNEDGDIGDNTGNQGGNNTGNQGDNNTGNQGGNDNKDTCQGHVDSNNDDYCDICRDYLIVVVDFYVFNDLHGKFCDTDTQPGVDEIGTYLDKQNDDYQVLLSSGDMWQGSAESVLTEGKIMIDWMNELGFAAMTLGNHEFDWGEEQIRTNAAHADFPFLAINVYDNSTGKLANYCTPSVMVECGDLQIGVIGAIGDCYSSISSEFSSGFNFKTGTALTNLVKAESERLRGLGADYIVYSLHDGDSGSSTSCYDSVLSGGYVDLVFEAHTHQSYCKIDSYGIYHIQAGGENDGLSHVEIEINVLTGKNAVTESGVVYSSAYANLADHAPTEDIEDNYSDIIDYAYAVLGNVSKTYSDSEIEDYVAQLYLEAGLAKWGDKYNIYLGGGFLKTRTPYNLTAGDKTYGDLLSLFPFNNRIVLCSISGSKLQNKFVNNTNENYHIYKSTYGENTSIQSNATYYVICDTYTAYYKYNGVYVNGLTVIEEYDATTYARDLLADAIQAGKLGTGSGTGTGGNTGSGSGSNSGSGSGSNSGNDTYTLTSFSEANEIASGFSNYESTTNYYYLKGTVRLVQNTTTYFFIQDESGNEIRVYLLKDQNGNDATGTLSNGDEIIVYAKIGKYNNATQLSSPKLIQIIN